MSEAELLIATSNEGKLREARAILKDLPFVTRSLAGYPFIEPITETGVTFVENATLKAMGYARQTKVLTLADDSGLEVEALNGAPGVWSARYMDEHASYFDRNESLLSKLQGEQNRAARFVCAVVIADAEGRLLNVSTGICVGHIANSQRGSGGFGYDPIFIPAGFEKTFAELPSLLKNRISHRAQALNDARAFLQCLTQPSSDS